MFFDDDIPVWGFIGKVEVTPAVAGDAEVQEGVTRLYLFTHFHFDIGYNKNQVAGARCAGAERHLMLSSARRV